MSKIPSGTCPGISPSDINCDQKFIFLCIDVFHNLCTKSNSNSLTVNFNGPSNTNSPSLTVSYPINMSNILSSIKLSSFHYSNEDFNDLSIRKNNKNHK